MTPEDKTFIEQWRSGKGDLTITLAAASNDMGKQMAQFCDELNEMVTSLKIKKESDETGFSPPAIIMGQHNNIAFQALPSGKILGLFLSTLDTAPEDADDAADLDSAIHAQMKQIDLPVALKLFIAPQCPHCPVALETLLSLANANRHLRLTIINAQQFEQASQKDQVRSVPTLILDNQFRWTGPLDLQEIMTLCIQRDPAQLSAASLRQLIEDGQAQRVAQMMVDANTLFPALLDLLTHDRWSVRLGAMVTAEYLAAEAEPLALDLAVLLWNHFGELSDPVKGDVVHVIGQVNDDITRGYLEGVLSGPFDETVKEAATDALEDMQ